MKEEGRKRLATNRQSDGEKPGHQLDGGGERLGLFPVMR
jgi:hypothetical protein